MSTVSPLPATTPSPERKRHNEIAPPRVDDKYFITAFRVRSRLERLVSDKALTAREWMVAREYARLHEIAFRGTVQSTRLDGIRRVQNYRGSRLERSETQHAAIARLRAVRTALGAVATDLIDACVVHDQSFCRTARAIRRDPKTVRSWTLIALRALAEAWSSIP